MKRAIFRSDKCDWFQNHSLASFSFRFCRAKTIAAPIRSRSSGVFATQLEIEPSAVFLKCKPDPGKHSRHKEARVAAVHTAA